MGKPQDLVYSGKYDSVIRTALKRPSPILEALEADVIKLPLENIAKQTRLERGEPIDTRLPHETVDTDNSVDIDFVVALQAGNLTTDHVSNLAEDDSTIVKEHQEMAIRFVQMNVKLVDGSLIDREIISAIKMSSFGSFDSDKLLIFYDAKAAGEDARRPDVWKAALRRPHLDRLMKLALSCRCDSDPLTINPSDFIVLFDAGRHGNTHTLLGSLKDDNDKAWCLLQHAMHMMRL